MTIWVVTQNVKEFEGIVRNKNKKAAEKSKRRTNKSTAKRPFLATLADAKIGAYTVEKAPPQIFRGKRNVAFDAMYKYVRRRKQGQSPADIAIGIIETSARLRQFVDDDTTLEGVLDYDPLLAKVGAFFRADSKNRRDMYATVRPTAAAINETREKSLTVATVSPSEADKWLAGRDASISFDTDSVFGAREVGSQVVLGVGDNYSEADLWTVADARKAAAVAKLYALSASQYGKRNKSLVSAAPAILRALRRASDLRFSPALEDPLALLGNKSEEETKEIISKTGLGASPGDVMAAIAHTPIRITVTSVKSTRDFRPKQTRCVPKVFEIY